MREKTEQRSYSQLGLIWDQPFEGGTPITEYKVEIAPSGSSEFVLLTETTNTAFLATELTNGQTYDFRVMAKNVYGYSDPSATLTLLAAYIPSVPTNVETVMDLQN